MSRPAAAMPATVPAGSEVHPFLRSRSVPLWGLLAPLVSLALLIIIFSQQPDGRLHMWVFDVGQGDSIFLRTPQGHTALIDGGPGPSAVLDGLGEHIPFWEHAVNLVVLTHPHDDHMAGLVEVAQRYRVDQVVQTVFTSTVGAEGEWLRVLQERHILVHDARRGDVITFNDEPGVTLQVLSPKTPDAKEEGRNGDVNNTSIVLRVSYGGRTFLLEGDAQQGAEASMIRDLPGDLPADVLKVAHHGSDTSSSLRFIEAVHPSVAVISVGAGNKFGQPARQTLDALQQDGTRVYRTDQNGTVEVIADESNLWVRTEK